MSGRSFLAGGLVVGGLLAGAALVAASSSAPEDAPPSSAATGPQDPTPASSTSVPEDPTAASPAPATQDPTPASSTPATARESRPLSQLLRVYVEEHRHAVGVVAARIGPDGVEVGAAGRAAGPGSGPPSSRTLFEIGSVTKVFTGLLLADMVERGEVRPGTTVGELHPEPDRLDPAVAEITLEELSTHTSGLPRLPLHGPMLWRLALRPGDPYRGSTTEELFRAAERLDADDVSGRGTFEYSNLGPALLGRLLQQAAGVPYETLLEERVLDRLGLTGTGFAADDPATGAPLAHGHRENLWPAAHWTLDAYAPAGGLLSNLDDMVRLVERALAADDPVLERSLVPLHQEDEGRAGMGMGWVADAYEGEPFFWHNGRTGGFQAFVGLLPESGRGVAVLSNTSHLADPLAVALLRGDDTVPEREGSWFWLAFTLGLTLAAPWTLFVRRGELLQTAEGEAKRPRGRIHFFTGAVDAALFLALTQVLGEWHQLPVALWWAALGACAILVAVAAGPAMQLPWLPAGPGWKRALPVGGLAVAGAFTSWLMLGF